MSKIVTSLFNNESQASSIVQRLDQAGYGHGKICLFSNSGENRFWEGTSDRDVDTSDAGNDRVSRYLIDNGVPEHDAHAYAEGVRRGHALVAVRCDDDDADEVVSILDGENTLDLDERQESWRSEGWTGSAAGSGAGAGMMGIADSLTGTSSGSMSRDDSYRSTTGSDFTSDERLTASSGMSERDTNLNRDGRDEVIPVAEEELHVGKREVGRGRVRVVSHVVERPVEEQVSLREERVQVERRPVEGSTRTGALNDGDVFRERSIEVEERGEEAVVSKDARIVEEVVVRKDVEERNQTVSDTVRRTEVEIEDERGNRVSRTGTTDDER